MPATMENRIINETSRINEMKKLRNEGYSNAEIAKQMNISHGSVLRRIGYQPKHTTSSNLKIGHAIRKQKIALKSSARTDYQNKAKLIAEYNKKVNQLLIQAKELTDILAKLPKDLNVQPLEIKF